MLSHRLHDLPFGALQDRLAALGHPKYRASQIWQGMFVELADGYRDITTLPKPLRSRLDWELPWTSLKLARFARAQDGDTAKALFQLEDGEMIESVFMIYPKRGTVCLSTQVGCAMACTFCATGLGGFVRHLASGEIVAQACAAARWFAEHDRRLTNLVYMGMGEPLDNYDATLDSIRILNDRRGMNLGARSFTVSTVGIPSGIDRLAKEPLQVNLAVSLHASNDRLRSQLVPVNRQHPIPKLMRACRRYIDSTHRRVTFEMALIREVNDSDTDARELARLLAGLLCHVNLIPLNASPSTDADPSSGHRVKAYAAILEQHRIPVSIRDSRGSEIEAGCGQLRAKGLKP